MLPFPERILVRRPKFVLIVLTETGFFALTCVNTGGGQQYIILIAENLT